jgi:type II secretory pathway component PulK
MMLRTPTSLTSKPHAGRPAVVLLAVLVVVVLLTLAAYEFSGLMLAEYRAADSSKRYAEAHALAESGVNYGAALLGNSDAMTNTLGGNAFDNTGAFQGVVVHADEKPRFQGRFSILSPVGPDDAGTGQGYRFGVTDESGKINLNALMKIDSSGKVAHDMLMTLPNMTEDIANAILDWIDPDSDTRTNGAEDDYYSGLSPPYHCKNGPLDTIEELLLVKGVTPQLLFGNDRNRNGMLDADEDDGQGVSDGGWASYLTIWSRELNVDSQGNPRIYINGSDLQSLYDQLNTVVGTDLANYIIAYRLYGPASSGGPGSGGNSGSGGAGSGGNSGSGGAGAAAAAGGGNSPNARSASPAPAAASTGGTSMQAGAARSTGSSAGGAATAGGGMSGGGMSGSGSGGNASGGRLNRNQLSFGPNSRPRSIASLYELVNSSVSIPAGSSSSTSASTSTSANGRTQTTTVVRTTTSAVVVYPSPLNDPGQQRQLLPMLLDETTTSRGTELPARINVNTAPRAVLAALPGLADADVENIIEHRSDPTAAAGASDPIYQTTAWLLTDANLTPATLRSLERYITARSQVYRFQSVGYFDGGGPTARLEAVVDANSGRPRIVYLRDLTELGKGFDLNQR